jgi:hypothetical protein
MKIEKDGIFINITDGSEIMAQLEINDLLKALSAGIVASDKGELDANGDELFSFLVALRDMYGMED